MSISENSGPVFIKVEGMRDESVYVLRENIEVIFDVEMVPEAGSSVRARLKGSLTVMGVNTRARDILDLLCVQVIEPSPLKV